MAADVEIRTGKTISPAQRQQAQDVASRIRRGLEDIAPLIEQAWRERHWELLGHASWQDYLEDEFGEHRVAGRKALVSFLAGEGLNAKQIERETGLPRTTVRRDLGQGGGHMWPPQPDQANVTKPVTRKRGGRSTAQRVAEHRERKRQQEPAAAPPAAPERPAEPRAQADLEALREQAREEVRAEMRAKFEKAWEALAAERNELRAEVERLKSGRGTCRQHKVPLALVCPACLGLEGELPAPSAAGTAGPLRQHYSARPGT